MKVLPDDTGLLVGDSLTALLLVQPWPEDWHTDSMPCVLSASQGSDVDGYSAQRDAL